MINLKKIISSSLAILALASCEKNDDYESVRGIKPIVSIDKTNVSIVEGSNATFTLTVDTPYKSDMDFKIEVVDGGTAKYNDIIADGVESIIQGTDGYGQGAIGYEFVFPANAKTFTFTIDAVKDLILDGNESLTLKLISSKNGLLAIAPASTFVNVNISDYVNPNEIGFRCNWSHATDFYGSFQSEKYIGADDLKHGWDGYDIDFYVYDSANTDALGFAAATGAAPEVGTFDALAPTADETYILSAEVFGLPPAALRPKFVTNRPIKLEVCRYGSWSASISVPFVAGPAGPGVTTAGSVITLGTLEKTGSTYTVKNSAGVIIASGRVNNASFPVKSSL
jgi:hypothetical protein